MAALAACAVLVGADGRSMLGVRLGLFGSAVADEPVTRLSHDDAFAYAQRAEKRLRTDEW